MNRPDDEVAAQFIVKQLEHGVQNMEPATRERLAAVRRAALARYQERPAPVLGLAWAHSAVTGRSEHRVHAARYVIAGAVLVLSLAGFAYWQSMGSNTNDISEIDISLLTDDLPINAYLDKGFDSWLKRSPR